MDYAANKKVKADRVYRTIGKMNIWRIILGVLLLVCVLLISGTVSELCASRSHFRAAQVFMIAPSWMEEYKPQERAYFAAGALYEEGDYNSALNAFSEIEDYEPARAMEARCLLALAARAADEGDTAKAAELAAEIDTALLNEDEIKQLEAIKTQIK